MELETIKEKRNYNNCKYTKAKENVEYIQKQLRKNLEYVNDISSTLKKIKKVKYCFNFIMKNWYFEKIYEDKVIGVEKRITDYLHLYEVAILKRKILKSKLKQAQREFTKRQKSNIKFEKKHFNEEV